MIRISFTIMKDFKEETGGDNIAWLDCPICEWGGEVYYATKPPTYCSNTCKQKAARLRRQERQEAESRSRFLAESKKEMELTEPVQLRCGCGWPVYVSRWQLGNGPEVFCLSCRQLYQPV